MDRNLDPRVTIAMIASLGMDTYLENTQVPEELMRDTPRLGMC